MAKSQNSPRGLAAKKMLFLVPTVTAIPSTRVGPGAIAAMTDGTGTILVINTTGTTWEYVSNTSVRPGV